MNTTAHDFVTVDMRGLKAALVARAQAERVSVSVLGFTYRQLGERLAQLKAKKDAADKAAEQRLQALREIADEKAKADDEPTRLGLTQPGEYGLFAILREHAANKDETYLSDCARRLVAYLRGHQLLLAGWSNSKGGRMRIEQSLIAELWNPDYAALGFATNGEPFVGAAVRELAETVGAS